MSTNTDWNEIYAKNASRMLGICRRYLQSTALAEDVLHDAFLTAIDKSETYKGKGNVEAWLRRIVVNTALQHIKKNQHFSIVNCEALPDEGYVPDYDPLDHLNKSSIIRYCNFDQEELIEVIDQLPLHHRTVFNLYVIDNFKHHQIAEKLGISAGTSKSHLSRARKKIQRLLHQMAIEKYKQRERRKLAVLFFMPFSLDKMFKKAFKQYTLPSLESLQIPPGIGSMPHLGMQVGLSKLSIASILFFGIGICTFLFFTRPEKKESVIPDNLDFLEKPLNNEQPNNLAKGKKESKLDSIERQPASKETSSLMMEDSSSVKDPVVIRQKVIVVDTLYQYEQ